MQKKYSNLLSFEEEEIIIIIILFFLIFWHVRFHRIVSKWIWLDVRGYFVTSDARMIYEIRHPMARGTVIPLYGSDVFIFLDSTTRLMDFRLDRFMCKRDKISWNFTLLLSDPHSFSSNPG